MKHATEEALDTLEPLLQKIRVFPDLKERKRGSFYRKSSAFLHFHEDGNDLFADVKVDGKWQRYPATSAKQQTLFMKALRLLLRS